MVLNRTEQVTAAARITAVHRRERRTQVVHEHGYTIDAIWQQSDHLRGQQQSGRYKRANSNFASRKHIHAM